MTEKQSCCSRAKGKNVGTCGQASASPPAPLRHLFARAAYISLLAFLLFYSTLVPLFPSNRKIHSIIRPMAKGGGGASGKKGTQKGTTSKGTTPPESKDGDQDDPPTHQGEVEAATGAQGKDAKVSLLLVGRSCVVVMQKIVKLRSRKHRHFPSKMGKR